MAVDARSLLSVSCKLTSISNNSQKSEVNRLTITIHSSPQASKECPFNVTARSLRIILKLKIMFLLHYLQSPVCLKIRLFLISASPTANHDVTLQ